MGLIVRISRDRGRSWTDDSKRVTMENRGRGTGNSRTFHERLGTNEVKNIMKWECNRFILLRRSQWKFVFRREHDDSFCSNERHAGKKIRQIVSCIFHRDVSCFLTRTACSSGSHRSDIFHDESYGRDFLNRTFVSLLWSISRAWCLLDVISLSSLWIS